MTTFPAEEQPDLTVSAARQEQKPEKKPNTAPEKPRVAPARGKAGKKASVGKRAPKTTSIAKAPKAAKGEGHGATREGSKTAKVLELVKRPEGATLKQIIKSTGWQPHTCSRLHQRHARQKDEARRRIHEGRGRGARL